MRFLFGVWPAIQNINLGLSYLACWVHCIVATTSKIVTAERTPRRRACPNRHPAVAEVLGAGCMASAGSSDSIGISTAVRILLLNISVSVECYHPWVDGLLCIQWAPNQLGCYRYQASPIVVCGLGVALSSGFFYFWGHPYVILCGSVSDYFSQGFISVRQLMGWVIRTGRG